MQKGLFFFLPRCFSIGNKSHKYNKMEVEFCNSKITMCKATLKMVIDGHYLNAHQIVALEWVYLLYLFSMLEHSAHSDKQSPACQFIVGCMHHIISPWSIGWMHCLFIIVVREAIILFQRSYIFLLYHKTIFHYIITTSLS